VARLKGLRLFAALPLTAMLLAGCGGGHGRPEVAATVQHYLNTLGPEQRSAFPIGAGPPRVKEDSCKKIGRPARLRGGFVRAPRPQVRLAFWSCVVRFAHVPFHVRVALNDKGKVVWAMLMPRQVLRPGTATVYQGGPKQPKP
jgi:hypothetical protein